MLFNKILEKTMKICVIENFSKFKINKANVNFSLWTRNQSAVKSTDYIEPARSSAVLPNSNIGLKRIPKFLIL